MPEREIVQLHTIEQWMTQTEEVKLAILRNIKLKDKLHRFLLSLNERRGGGLTEAKWVRCSKCAESQHPGYFLFEPRYDGLHPSAMGRECLLQIYNEMIGVPGQEHVEPRGRLIFDTGSAIHHMFQTYGLKGAWGPHYRKEAKLTAEWQWLADELMIEGSADAENIMTIDDIPGCPIYEVGLIHEYKSMKKEIFEKLTGPKPEHKQQAIIYSAVLNRPVVVYLYMNKNDQNLADFPVAFDHAVWAKLESKARLMKQYYESGTAPPGKVGFHCRDCQYVYNCPDYAADAAKRTAARR
jgi:CRISPR/Cas system-associated exonuclease Cas4 (RecB family)